MAELPHLAATILCLPADLRHEKFDLTMAGHGAGNRADISVEWPFLLWKLYWTTVQTCFSSRRIYKKKEAVHDKTVLK